MRRVLWLILAIAALFAVWLWWRGLSAPPSPPGPATLVRVALAVNGSRQTALTAGAPLVFALTLRNAAAARAAADRVARAAWKEDLDDLVAEGSITRQQADELLRREPVPAPVAAAAVTLAPGEFSLVSDTTAPLPWRPRVIEPLAPVDVVLDEKTVAYATLVVPPGATAEGTYRLHARFEHRPRRPGQWQGTVTSQPVTIFIAAAPPAPTLDQQKEALLVLVEYHLAVRDYDRAIATARQVLALDPQSADGFALLGKAQEARGDLRAALASYESAFREFRRRNPDAHEPALHLLLQVRRLERQLRITRPQVRNKP